MTWCYILQMLIACVPFEFDTFFLALNWAIAKEHVCLIFALDQDTNKFSTLPIHFIVAINVNIICMY